MKAGHLSEYFTGVAAKHLSAVEADFARSNQHEFNGVEPLKKILGTEKNKFPAKFIYLTDNDDQPVVAEGLLTWYDSRKNKRDKRSAEYRLYFSTTSVSECAAQGDLLVIGRRPDGSLLVIIAESNSTIASQVQWLFGLSDLSHPGFSVRAELETDQDRIEFAAQFILENIGIVVETTEESHLDVMLREFDGNFPSTRVFSEFARSTLKDLNAKDDPDAVIMAWMEREEILFRTLERHLIGDHLKNGFKGDVDGFIGYSLSIQNRRKSRVGKAFENHLEKILVDCGVKYSRNGLTENKNRVDFIFPGEREYQDKAFNPIRLTMLGVKSTCKDRWRQVLSEADRINEKHLLTLEAAISIAQTNEMKARHLQLVLPRILYATYNSVQQGWLMDVKSFINMVLARQ
jgi:hypothetical protein